MHERVCVCERAREREREGPGEKDADTCVCCRDSRVCQIICMIASLLSQLIIRDYFP